MLYWLLAPLGEDITLLNLFNYITFRTGGAMMTALAFVFIFGSPFIRWLRKKQREGQPIREDGPERHIIEKAGTPTMGGFLILTGMLLATLLWGDLSNPYLWVVIFVTAGYGAIGFVDDYRKVTKRSSAGLPGSAKLVLQFLIAGAAVFWMTQLLSNAPDVPEGFATSIAMPFFKDVLIPLGPLFLVFGTLVIAGASNAVNLTDGLDGLAIVPVMIAAASFGFIAYIVGNFVFANYLQLNFTPGTGELAVFCGALLGASLGFLWYNAPPAMVFMGDTGSLSLGGAIGTIAVAVKHEIVLAIIGGLFVLEAVSVMVQIASFKLFGKRVFKMAPIHHHFEKMGWQEPTIVIRFWIIAVILALIGLSTLKLR
ncbi:phospho-N-acetylmuramoyl-pentapeptide-transferase [Hyphobacterium sp. SN044]|uniref:phospho-N-acetylmuramoyl-pentapeptide- transferase n=1 Tax=Hyphobacterium sp. SN044 TaxID=2912575 RepID=UPI001F0133EF|nr:phospho-N-acetylmuramoyl-pentapeptide-transferase [Hyphobacterium sp. SN044]MCF8878365.1 phospho-N-acetylmuramoyl-pentapeptide-transferase [Hyphobacterium sp. SN044]